MLQPSTFRRPRPLHAGLLLLLATLVAAPGAFSQTASVGYTSTSAGTAPASIYPFLSAPVAGNPDTVIVVPFAFNSIGNYTLSSTSLLLSAAPLAGGSGPAEGGNPHGGGTGAGSAGEVGLYQVSIQIFSFLPGSLTLPTSLVTYSTLIGAADIAVPRVFTYSVNSAATFTAGSTYYMAISLGGILKWDMITGDSNGGSYPGDNPVTSLVGDGTPLVYYQITSSGVQSLYGNVGGFTITANAVTAIPEPASVGAIAGSGVLAMAAWVRRRRRGAEVGSL